MWADRALMSSEQIKLSGRLGKHKVMCNYQARRAFLACCRPKGVK
jgi:hypothetical protein